MNILSDQNVLLWDDISNALLRARLDIEENGFLPPRVLIISEVKGSGVLDLSRVPQPVWRHIIQEVVTQTVAVEVILIQESHKQTRNFQKVKKEQGFVNGITAIAKTSDDEIAAVLPFTKFLTFEIGRDIPLLYVKKFSFTFEDVQHIKNTAHYLFSGLSLERYSTENFTPSIH